METVYTNQKKRFAVAIYMYMLKKNKAHIQFPKVICRSLLLASGVQCYFELLAILKMDHPQARMLGGFGGFGQTTHSLVEVRGGACVCMALGHLAWP